MKNTHGSTAVQTDISVGNGSKGVRDPQTVIPAARLLNLRSAGIYLGLSYWTIRDLVFSGLIPTVKIPCPRAVHGRSIRRILVDRNDLDRLIEQNKETES